jgi:hypothetical protein
MNAHRGQKPEIDSIEVTNHARDRYLQRVEFDPYPAEQIRELLKDAEPSEEHKQTAKDSIAWAADGAIVVTDRTLEAVTTVLRPGGT